MVFGYSMIFNNRQQIIDHILWMMNSELNKGGGNSIVLLDSTFVDKMLRTMENYDHLVVGDLSIPILHVDNIDFSKIGEGRVTVNMKTKSFEAIGFDAYRIAIERAPESLEGKRMRWVKNAWFWHNIVGHVGLQLCVWLGFKKLGMRIHDATQPKPIGLKTDP